MVCNDSGLLASNQPVPSSSRAKIVDEITRTNHNHVPVGRGRQEGAVPAHDVSGSCGYRTRKELVVITVRTNRLRQGGCQDQSGGGSDQLQHGFKIHTGKARRQSFADPNVFLDDLVGDHELDSSVAPGRKYIARRSTKEHA